MMRIGFLPSDFNPMVLMLGEAEDFRALAGVLRQFTRTAEPVRLDQLAFCRNGGTPVTLKAADGRLGVHRAPEDGNAFLWWLTPVEAEAFAALADRLADPQRVAGSEMLECSISEEIPVKLSRGEYTEDFLCHEPDTAQA